MKVKYHPTMTVEEVERYAILGLLDGNLNDVIKQVFKTFVEEKRKAYEEGYEAGKAREDDTQYESGHKDGYYQGWDDFREGLSHSCGG